MFHAGSYFICWLLNCWLHHPLPSWNVYCTYGKMNWMNLVINCKVQTRSPAVAEIADRTFRLFRHIILLTSLLYDVAVVKEIWKLCGWGVWGLSYGVRGWELQNLAPRRGLPFHLFWHFCFRMYRVYKSGLENCFEKNLGFLGFKKTKKPQKSKI